MTQNTKSRLTEILVQGRAAACHRCRGAVPVQVILAGHRAWWRRAPLTGRNTVFHEWSVRAAEIALVLRLSRRYQPVSSCARADRVSRAVAGRAREPRLCGLSSFARANAIQRTATSHTRDGSSWVRVAGVRQEREGGWRRAGACDDRWRCTRRHPVYRACRSVERVGLCYRRGSRGHR